MTKLNVTIYSIVSISVFCSKNSFTHFVAIIKPEMTLKLKIWEPSCRLMYVCWRNTSEFVVGFVLSFKSIKLLSQQIKYAVQKEKLLLSFNLHHFVRNVSFQDVGNHGSPKFPIVSSWYQCLSFAKKVFTARSNIHSNMIVRFLTNKFQLTLRLSVLFDYIFVMAS